MAKGKPILLFFHFRSLNLGKVKNHLPHFLVFSLQPIKFFFGDSHCAIRVTHWKFTNLKKMGQKVMWNRTMKSIMSQTLILTTISDLYVSLGFINHPFLHPVLHCKNIPSFNGLGFSIETPNVSSFFFNGGLHHPPIGNPVPTN